MRPLTCNLGGMMVRVQQRAEAQGHLYLPRVGTQEVDVFGTRTEGRADAEGNAEVAD